MRLGLYWPELLGVAALLVKCYGVAHSCIWSRQCIRLAVRRPDYMAWVARRLFTGMIDLILPESLYQADLIDWLVKLLISHRHCRSRAGSLLNCCEKSVSSKTKSPDKDSYNKTRNVPSKQQKNALKRMGAVIGRREKQKVGSKCWNSATLWSLSFETGRHRLYLSVIRLCQNMVQCCFIARIPSVRTEGPLTNLIFGCYYWNGDTTAQSFGWLPVLEK